jgi:polyisoprenoid-binding protein YceI
MVLPGLLTIGFPLLIAFVPLIFGMHRMAIAEMLGGYMAGVTVSGVLWAIFQNNAGGAWDNAKKSFEAGVEINGEMTYKGSDAHKAAVTGDTVGDPFKDTSGPSMNILIKLTCLIGLVIAPILGGHSTEIKTEAVNTEETIAPVKNTPTKNNISELQGIWNLDASHTYVDFSIRHILATSKGSFKTVNGTFNFSEENPSMNISIDVNSINTSNDKRDEHLKTAEYFDTALYPTITFTSNQITKTDNGFIAKGNLTIKDVTKEIELPINYLGKQDTPWGFPSAAFEGETTINRAEFHVSEAGGLLGDDVKITFSM